VPFSSVAVNWCTGKTAKGRYMPLCSIPGGTNSPRARVMTVSRAPGAVCAYDNRCISPLTSSPRTGITWPSGMTRPGAAGDPAGPGTPAAAVLDAPATALPETDEGRDLISMPSGRCATGDRISDRGSGPGWPAAPARRVPRASMKRSTI